MSRYLFLVLGLAISVANAGEQSPSKTADREQHDLAYSLGASLGERLRQEVPDLQIQALIEGLNQAYQGKPLALDNKRIEQILAQHEAQAEADAQAPKSEKSLAAEQQFLAKEKTAKGVRELADGILLTELTPGSGSKPGPNDQVQVKYIGRLPDGTVFDQSTQPQTASEPTEQYGTHPQGTGTALGSGSALAQFANSAFPYLGQWATSTVQSHVPTGQR